MDKTIMHCEPLDPNEHDLAVISYAGQAETKVVYWVSVHDSVPAPQGAFKR